MRVIAALVGTKGLGQQVYIALGKADMGKGLVAGLGMALIAMIADRMIQAWSAKKKAALASPNPEIDAGMGSFRHIACREDSCGRISR